MFRWTAARECPFFANGRAQARPVRMIQQNYDGNRSLALLALVFYLLLYTMIVFILLRLGFFALVVAIFVLDVVAATYFTTDFPAWYGESSLAAMMLACAIALIGFRLSLGSQPLFAPALEKA
jgi:hypothetical protein